MRHIGRMAEMRKSYKILIGRAKSKRPLGNIRCRLEVKLETGHKKTGYEYVDWVHLVQYRVQW